MTKMIIADGDRCLACGSCRLACAMAHTDAPTLAEAMQHEASPQARIFVEPYGRFGVPLQCRHCEDAPCMTVCPTQAIRRLSAMGPVLLDAERCIICRQCLLVCPFGVIDLTRDGKAVIKCDQCVERTQAGADPACVAACPTGALQFQDITDHARARRGETVRRLASVES